MIFHWEATIALRAVQHHTGEQPLTLAGEGLWVCLVSSGSCLAAGAESTAGAPAAARAGQLVLARPPLTLTPAPACHLLAMRLAGSAAADFAAGLPHSPFLALGETCPAAAELMGELARQQEQNAPARSRSQLAFTLLCELSEADSAAPALPPLVLAAINDIRSNYAGLYGVEELSERLGVSKSHLVRSFTAAMGVSPGRYLTAVRIEAVQRLLLHREYNLDIIASLCGFSGANYLCRVFKKEVGQTPAQWRAMATRASVGGLSPEENRRELELYV